MTGVVAWAGFLGGWLLFAGPIFQAAYELSEAELDRAALQEAASGVAGPPPSPWWWLVPPVAYVKSRRRAAAQRRALIAALDPAELHQAVTYSATAHGWLMVAAGAILIAVGETWGLCEYYRAGTWTFAVVAGGMALLSVLHAAGRLAYLQAAEAGAGAGGTTRSWRRLGR